MEKNKNATVENSFTAVKKIACPPKSPALKGFADGP